VRRAVLTPRHGEERQPANQNGPGRKLLRFKSKSSLFGIIQVAENCHKRLKLMTLDRYVAPALFVMFANLIDFKKIYLNLN